MTKIVVTGAAGKMGRTILYLALQDKEIEVVGATERKGHPLIGSPLSQLGIVSGQEEIKIEDDLLKGVKDWDVVIDFTEPKASLSHFTVAKDTKKGIIIGTTGFSKDEMEWIKKWEKDVKAVISPNMSIGMNIMFDVVERLSRLMKDDYDIEIVEMHHRMKKDAPSGTALRLKDAVISSDSSKEWLEVYGRKGITGERRREEVGVMALRGGDVVGEHTVIFAGIGERVEVTHRAYSRENFARGALFAAKWLYRRENGIYSMKDVLGI
ncbi:MAG: 4-hydroxy-tetrahydrodipicolinate reductase [Syntrophorhabdaceae bacterium]|nr:4-hydroxy-tetrahydrodipicolinate reductase [Syntrophorhabdaceae bacterium]